MIYWDLFQNITYLHGTERLKDFLHKFEMKALEIKLNVVVEILETKEKKINNVVDYLKESKSELIDLHRQYYGKSEYDLMVCI